jgi:hypothetical protein
LKYFHRLAPLLARLHDDGCQRDKAGNRQLHFDQYTMLVLLFLFNPIVSSLRAIVQASEVWINPPTDRPEPRMLQLPRDTNFVPQLSQTY